MIGLLEPCSSRLSPIAFTCGDLRLIPDFAAKALPARFSQTSAIRQRPPGCERFPFTPSNKPAMWWYSNGSAFTSFAMNQRHGR